MIATMRHMSRYAAQKPAMITALSVASVIEDSSDDSSGDTECRNDDACECRCKDGYCGGDCACREDCEGYDLVLSECFHD